jgi:peptidoglycan/xylan/chitin deacetylase (PgdA/CDA1 family)
MPPDHGRFPYRPIVDRPPLRWPNGAFVAVWVIPNIEHFRFDRPFAASPGSGAVPDVPGYAARDYGNRVGVWRFMRVLDRYGIRATVALNADVCDYEPEIVRAGCERGWEWMGHGQTNSVRLDELAQDEEERRVIGDTLARIEAATGARPRGWLGPGLAETVRTPDLLREAGLSYVADWVNDDQPYAMDTAHGALYAIPYTLELNDKRIIEARGASGRDFYAAIVDQFDTLYQEGADSGRVMAIALHPYLMGVPHRIRYLDEGLAYIHRHEHVWWATGAEIVDAYRQHCEGRD